MAAGILGLGASLGGALALWIAGPVILGATQHPDGTAPVAEDLVQGRADAWDRLTVPVTVENAGPYRFMIDTGSQATVLSSALATQLKLASGPRVRVVSIAGEDHVGTARIDRIAFGQQEVFGLTVPLLEDQHIGADGIIGTDSLQNMRVVLDLARERIVIGTPSEVGPANGYEIVVRARRKLGRLILTDATIDGIKVDVIVDTGASGTIGNRALQKAMRQRARGTATLESVTGASLPADTALARDLNLGGMNLANVFVAYADAPAFNELKLDRKPALFLGMRELRAFKRIAIDFPTRRVMFDL